MGVKGFHALRLETPMVLVATRSRRYGWSVVHSGAVVQPQPGEGTITGIDPSSRWLSAMSSSHLVNSRRRSYCAIIVSAATWTSPVHPFFSYTGVSVGR